MMNLSDNRANILAAIITITFAIIVVFSILEFRNNTYTAVCKDYKNYLNLQIGGRVIEKDIDTQNHGYTSIFLNNQNDTLCLFNIDTFFFENVNEGDSIFKSKNSDTLTLLTKEKKLRKFIISYGCPSKMRKEMNKSDYKPR